MIVDRAPSYKPPKDAKGVDALTGTDPFILHADGVAWLFLAERTAAGSHADLL